MFDFYFLISAILLVLFDYGYIYLMHGFFQSQIQHIQSSPLKLNFVSAFICYILLITGLNYFIIKPKKSVQDAFLLGIIIYGVFETTNYALLEKWSILTVFIDTLWGGILFALTTGIINKIRYIF